MHTFSLPENSPNLIHHKFFQPVDSMTKDKQVGHFISNQDLSLSIVSMVAIQTTFSFSTKNPSKQSSANFNKCNFSRFTDYLFWVLNSYYHIKSTWFKGQIDYETDFCIGMCVSFKEKLKWLSHYILKRSTKITPKSLSLLK